MIEHDIPQSTWQDDPLRESKGILLGVTLSAALLVVGAALIWWIWP